MGTRTQHKPGLFSFVDLMAGDAAKAEAFYSAVFGWKCEKQDTQGGPPYWQFFKEHNGKLENVAGMGQMSNDMKAAGVPSYWNNYVTVEDVQSVCTQAEKLGGKITLPPMKVMEAGHMAMIQDREGAQLSIWQPLDHIGATLVNVPGSFCWNELNTRDFEKSVPFYQDLFGWNIKGDQNAENPYLSIMNGDRSNGGVMMIPPNEQMPVTWSTYFAVEEMEAFKKSVTDNGGQLCSGDIPVPDVGKLVICGDSQGAFFVGIELSTADD